MVDVLLNFVIFLDDRLNLTINNYLDSDIKYLNNFFSRSFIFIIQSKRPQKNKRKIAKEQKKIDGKKIKNCRGRKMMKRKSVVDKEERAENDV